MDWKKEISKFNWKMNKEKLIFLFCSGLLLFMISIPSGKGDGTENLPASGREQERTGSMGEEQAGRGSSDTSYEEELEERIASILSRVDGVGDVDVMVVLESTGEKVFRVDTSVSSSRSEEVSQDGENRISDQKETTESTVLGGSGTDEGPLIEKERMPEISGIIISADGGGSDLVKAEISEAMEALFGLPAHKIKVLKRVKKGV